jgi:hypothetical protein
MEELSLMLRGFLIKLTSLDGQLEDIKGELDLREKLMTEEATFAIIVETKDDSEPSTNSGIDGVSSSMIDVTTADDSQYHHGFQRCLPIHYARPHHKIHHGIMNFYYM